MTSPPGVTDRLPTEYAEDEDESRGFRLRVIRRLLSQWAASYLAVSLSLLAILACFQFAISPSAPLLPLGVLDGVLIYRSAKEFARPSETDAYRSLTRPQHVLDIVENCCTLLCKLLLSISIVWPEVPTVVAGFPLAVHLLARLLYRESALNDCYAFSGMFRLMWRCTRLCALVTISLKLSHFVTWRWASVFWPLWISLSMLTLISVGILLLALGSLCALLAGEIQLKEIACVSWFLFISAGSCIVATAALTLVSRCLEGRDYWKYLPETLGTAAGFCATVAGWTWAMRGILGVWWDTFFSTMEVPDVPQQTPRSLAAHTRKVSRQLITVGQVTPRLLVHFTQIRVSSNYFKPASLVRKPKPKATTRLNFAPVIVSEGLDEDSKCQSPNRKLLADKQRCDTATPPAVPTRMSEFPPVIPPRNSEFSSPDDQSAPKQCVICCEFPANAVIMDCGHGGLCLSCATAMWKRADTCHYCRKQIINIVHVQDASKSLVAVVSVTYTKADGSSTIVSDNSQI